MTASVELPEQEISERTDIQRSESNVQDSFVLAKFTKCKRPGEQYENLGHSKRVTLVNHH